MCSSKITSHHITVAMQRSSPWETPGANSYDYSELIAQSATIFIRTKLICQSRLRAVQLPWISPSLLKLVCTHLAQVQGHKMSVMIDISNHLQSVTTHSKNKTSNTLDSYVCQRLVKTILQSAAFVVLHGAQFTIATLNRNHKKMCCCFLVV